ncbi:MAG: hypothetical protein KGL04_07050 [Elusimicrobia bacterium]|nr:hypothetical protein [Elusimicrobiota bacterium]
MDSVLVAPARACGRGKRFLKIFPFRWCRVPISSQLFGQLAADAGIEGIVYPSKFSGKDCLAVFPQNFENESYVVIRR